MCSALNKAERSRARVRKGDASFSISCKDVPRFICMHSVIRVCSTLYDYTILNPDNCSFMPCTESTTVLASSWESKTSGRGKCKSLRINLQMWTAYKQTDSLSKIHKVTIGLFQLHISDICFVKGYCTSNRKINKVKEYLNLEAVLEILSRICK